MLCFGFTIYKAKQNLWNRREVMALSLKDPPSSGPVMAASQHSAAPSNKILDDRLPGESLEWSLWRSVGALKDFLFVERCGE